MNDHLISSEATLVEALGRLNLLPGASMVLFAIDAGGQLTGSLTDGDIRRALLAGRRLDDKVETVCRHDCLRLEEGAPGIEVIAEARKREIRLLPVVSGGKVVSLLDLNSQRGLLPIEAVLMAGGAGERLRPLTASTPKPLLPVGNRPIIDHNIDLLRSFGIKKISVAVNYLKELIISHLSGAEDIMFIEEPRRMGTIGALSLVNPDNDNLLVMNADLLTDINLEAMYMKHVETKAWLTMAVVPYSISVPFAIVENEGDRITGLAEKPTYNYYANAGIYMLTREAAAVIPHEEYFDATDLADKLLREKRRITLFPIDGHWLDIGSPDDYRRACEIN